MRSRASEEKHMWPSPVAAFNNDERIPALDGLRGIAILLVMQHHFMFYGGMQPIGLIDKLFHTATLAGWCGVDLFFVLSGFLITGILYDAKGGDGYFRNFYIR